MVGLQKKNIKMYDDDDDDDDGDVLTFVIHGGCLYLRLGGCS